MRMPRLTVLVTLAVVAASTALVFTQTPPQSPPGGPTFEVVSVKLNAANQVNQSLNQRPDGGFTMTNIPISTLITRVYPFTTPRDMVGLPGWAMTDRYDINATSSLSSATQDQWAAMVRAMLADRFKLIVHIESRPQPVYELVLARSDGRLGHGLTKLDVDCARIEAERAEALRSAGRPQSPPERPDFKLPPPPCTVRTIMANLRDRSGDQQGALGDLLEGDLTMDTLALALRGASGRTVVNKTGLTGHYRIRMNFDSAFNRGGLGPDPNAPLDAPPSVFTALPPLGLKLESATIPRDTLIIDRLERPTEN